MSMPLRPNTPVILTAGLGATGISAGLVHAVWLTVVGLILLGTVVTLSKLGPRLAVEPVRQTDGRYRMRLTRNGREIGRNPSRP